MGYPTQKPIILLERIINLVTDIGDVVLDPFCGSGTTLVASSLLGRKYCGMDSSSDAVQLTKERLKNPIKTSSHLMENGKESYMNKDEAVQNILKQIDATVVQRNKGIDGFLKKHYKNTPIPVYIQRENQTLIDAVNLLKLAGDKKGAIKKILIRTNQSSPLKGKIMDEMENLDIVIVDHIDFQVKARLGL